MKLDNKLNQVSLFYSYSHKDEALRDTLETHLSILARKGVISQWHDRRILAGSEWESEISNQIEAADIILLLVSPDFIASDYCYSKELKKAIERHESNQSKVIPIVIRPVDWLDTDVPFAKLQALPKDAQPVTSWDNQDEAWLSIAKGVRKAVEDIVDLKTRRGAAFGLLSIRELLAVEVDQIDQAYQKDEEMTTFRGLSTGLSDLDKITDGLHNSEFVVIASRPGMGKTDLVLGIAAHTAIVETKPVAYFSLNLPADRITRRLIASVGHISPYKLLRGAMDDQDWQRLTSAVSILTNAPLFIDDSLSLTIPLLKEKLETIRKEHGLALVIIDSFQHLVIEAQSENTQNPNVSLEKNIKNLAKEFQIPILITSSISHEIEARPNKRPVVRDLDEVRGLEDDADTIIFVYRDEVYDENSMDKGKAELIVAKNSEGPVGTVRFTYLKEYARFVNFVPDLYEEK